MVSDTFYNGFQCQGCLLRIIYSDENGKCAFFKSMHGKNGEFGKCLIDTANSEQEDEENGEEDNIC